MDDLLILLLLFVVGLVAGFVDAVAGGGGMLTLPALLYAGLPPQMAIATNKLQSTFGSGSAMLHFVRSGRVRLRECAFGVVCTAIGAGTGAVAVQLVDPGFLRRVIPFLLLSIALYFVLSPGLGFEERHPRLGQMPFHLLLGLSIGFYDGFFGPGTGTFWATAYVLLLGYNLTNATAHTKVMNFTSNIVSLLFFIGGGAVRYPQGLVMGVGQYLGARLGARMVVTRGARFIRPVFLTMVVAISARLLWDAFR